MFLLNSEPPSPVSYIKRGAELARRANIALGKICQVAALSLRHHLPAKHNKHTQIVGETGHYNSKHKEKEEKKMP